MTIILVLTLLFAQLSGVVEIDGAWWAISGRKIIVTGGSIGVGANTETASAAISVSTHGFTVPGISRKFTPKTRQADLPQTSSSRQRFDPCNDPFKPLPANRQRRTFAFP
jgi:hypothetical protein